jgi:hypothetical protein
VVIGTRPQAQKQPVPVPAPLLTAPSAPSGPSLADRLIFYLGRYADGNFVDREGRRMQAHGDGGMLMGLSSIAIEAVCDGLIDAPVFVEPGSGPELRPTLLDFEPARLRIPGGEAGLPGLTPGRQRAIRMASKFGGEESRLLSSWLARRIRGDEQGASPPDCVERLVARAAEASSTRAIEAFAYRLFANPDARRE